MLVGPININGVIYLKFRQHASFFPEVVCAIYYIIIYYGMILYRTVK